MLRITNTPLPMIADRLYGAESSTQALTPSMRQDIGHHQVWLNCLLDATDESELITTIRHRNQQHGIDTYVLQVYIHERHLPAFATLTSLLGNALTLSFDVPSGMAYRHLYIINGQQIDVDGSYGYYRLIAQPSTYQLHQYTRNQIDTKIPVQAMVAERSAPFEIDVVDDSGSVASNNSTSWTPVRMTQWQMSDWSHICERLSRQGLTAYLKHSQTKQHTPPKLIITSAYPSTEDGISSNIGALRFGQVLHDRVDAPIIAISEQYAAQPSHVSVQRFNSLAVSHPAQSADVANQTSPSALTFDTPAAFAPVTDTETIDEASIIANQHHSRYRIYKALTTATDLNIADTFILTDHSSLNHHYRATQILHLARNSLSHITGLTNSRRHQQRHASTLDAGSHLTQLTLISADTPWVGQLYSRNVLPPMTGITGMQSDGDSRNHMTPTHSYLLDNLAQAINRIEAQVGSNYGSHFTHRFDDQTLIQSIGDSEHLINTGSLLTQTRPSLFATTDEQAVESGYRHTDSNLAEWISDHREDNAYSQFNVRDGQVSATLKMGVINPAETPKQGISAATNAQINIKSGEALVLSTQAQTHAQAQEHNYQQHTPTLTQTALGGQHLAERLTQLATGLGRSVNNHKVIKTQLETIAKEQQTQTHQQTPFTLIDSNADISYVSADTIIHRTMGEMITTTQQDMRISSGDSHSQISSESLNIVADGQVSFTNAKENITLSAHTGKMEATAKQDVNITSSTKEVEVVATNKITITAGGASITLDGSNITIAAKEVTEKGGKHSKAGGAVDSSYLSRLPFDKLLEKEFFDEQIQLVDPMGNPLPNMKYLLTGKNVNIKSESDVEGKTSRIDSGDKEDEIKMQLVWSTFNNRNNK